MSSKIKYKISDIQNLKNSKTPFCTITVYDYASSLIINELNIPLVLVGDSASMVMFGYENTTRISVNELLFLTKAVSRGINRALIVADLPFMSYQPSNSLAVENAGRFIKEGRADAVKLEGGIEYIDRVENIVKAGIPVMGHIGLKPQSVLQESGYKIKGKTFESAKEIYRDAIALEKAGAFSVVLECVPVELADIITSKLKIPTIGIGAGAGCDGQIQVFHDLIGSFKKSSPKHAKKYLNIERSIAAAIENYIKDVRDRIFPNQSNYVAMHKNTLAELKKALENT